jgi:hypothetical protein
MLDAVKVLLQSISTLQATSLAHQFILPFAMAGRMPTDAEIDAEHSRLNAIEVDPLQLDVFHGLCREMRSQAVLLTHCPGRA